MKYWSIHTMLVMYGLERAGSRPLFGREVADRCHLHAGSVIRTLELLERRGFVESDREDADVARADHRSNPRTYWRLTDKGRKMLPAIHDDLRLLFDSVRSLMEKAPGESGHGVTSAAVDLITGDG